MAIDMSKMGSLTAQMMEDIENEHPESEVGDVVILCELQSPGGDDGITTIRTFCSSPKLHHQIGLVRMSLNALEG